jgi:hypothetical protein
VAFSSPEADSVAGFVAEGSAATDDLTVVAEGPAVAVDLAGVAEGPAVAVDPAEVAEGAALTVVWAEAMEAGTPCAAGVLCPHPASRPPPSSVAVVSETTVARACQYVFTMKQSIAFHDRATLIFGKP